jgi:hypothetical protein
VSFLSDWVAKLEEGHTITWGDSIVLQRVQMSLLNADKHHRQAREGQTMQELLEREVERQTAEITALHQKIAALGRKLVDQQRDESKVRDAERVVLSRAVEFDDAYKLYFSGDDDDAEHLDAVEKKLHAAVAALLAAEAAS